jgi:hypothetical protein
VASESASLRCLVQHFSRASAAATSRGRDSGRSLRGIRTTRLSGRAPRRRRRTRQFDKEAIYFYFENKEELFRAVVRNSIQPTFRTATTLVERYAGPTQELLRRVIARFYAEIVEDPKRRQLLRLIVAEGSNFPEVAEFTTTSFSAKAIKL